MTHKVNEVTSDFLKIPQAHSHWGMEILAETLKRKIVHETRRLGRHVVNMIHLQKETSALSRNRKRKHQDCDPQEKNTIHKQRELNEEAPHKHQPEKPHVIYSLAYLTEYRPRFPSQCAFCNKRPAAVWRAAGLPTY